MARPRARRPEGPAAASHPPAHEVAFRAFLRVDNRNVANMTVEPSPGASGVSELFQLLRDGAPRTRADLAKSTGLARSTIAARVDQLMRMGLVIPMADGVSTGGRPPSRFAINPR